ncbi:DUF2167 domain-containing protein [Paenibacillus sp. MAH-36]|uniref:DUF2167 domain-containing protein n=1 Tax=Paenibacillus violae TaxID=3077234 RepID=A0ABU3R9F7_9BACL|nr:DUF2167 domain-containing protein [Paenibacillus sp. PFR10]MDU0200875.1 DUF2167 domain-containing protein [Paenibacillus sp. PFR10]
MKIRVLSILVILLLSTQTSVFAEEEQSKHTYNWVSGGKNVELGKIASLDLGQDFVFLNGEDTKKMMTDYKDIPSGREIGSVYPTNPKEQWTVIFEYDESGHIKDDEKKTIDDAAILKSYSDSTEKANEKLPLDHQLHVTGWDVKPFYDEKTHDLTWSMGAEDAKKQPLINYDVRLLTRTGYISAILISDPLSREHDKQVLASQILPKISMVNGQKYEDFNSSTDKVSKFGLSDLILGGAGLAVAKKVGLLAGGLLLLKKFGVFIVIALAGSWKWIKNLITTRKRNPNANSSEISEEKHQV